MSEKIVEASVGLFCVIGPAVTSSIGRTWREQLDEAEQHAKMLLQRNHREYGSGRPKPNRLLVVQVISVVEIEGPPVSVRPVNTADVQEMIHGD